MSTDRIFNTKNKPRRNVSRDVLTHQNTLRVFRSSPEDVHLQLRRVSDYVGISLSFAEARDVAAALLEACGDISPVLDAVVRARPIAAPSSNYKEKSKCTHR